MKTRFPQQNKVFVQTNRSNVLGNVWSTKGIDLQTNLGVVRLAQKLVTNTTTTNDANLGRPGAFAHFDGRTWATCGTRIFKNSDNSLTTTFTADASSGVPTTFDSDASDLAIFDNRLWATIPNGLFSKVADGTGTGAWTSRSSPSAQTEKLAYFKATNLLYFVNSATVITAINTANVVSTSGTTGYIDLGTNIRSIVTMVATDADIWIATLAINENSGAVNPKGFYGSILQWDGVAAQVKAEYVLPTAGVLSMTVLDNIPYAMDSEGRLLKYNGYTFSEITRLPVTRTLLTNATQGTNAAAPGNGRFIHPNGLVATKNNTILALINNLNGDNTGTINENISSGAWEADLNTKSFTHRYNLTLSSFNSSTVTDFGQNRIVGAGALTTNPLGWDGSAGQSTVLAGATYYTNASNTLSGIFIDSPVNSTSDNEGQKRGYMVTTWFESQEMEENWGRLWTSFRKFLNANDTISYKYRLTEEDPTYASITWVDTTHFTTTTDITAYSPTATGFDGSTGGEVEIIQGTGSGATPHITSVTNNAGTYTVTLNEAVTGVTTGTAKARFQKWRFIGTINASTLPIKSWAQTAIQDANDSRIQIKCCFAFTGNGEFYNFTLYSNTNVPITN